MSEDIALIFAYHFPPENAIGALRPFRFCKYLTRLGYRCHVISAADVSEVPEISARSVADPFVENAGQGIGWQFERAVRRFLLPGAVGTQWALQAYRAAVDFIDKNPHARITIFSTFPPVGVHLAAYCLARRKRLPWIADFRDPLADNPVYNHISPLTKSIYRKLEKIIVQAADFVIANTDTAQQKLRRAYPGRADRIQLIWNGFDPEDRLTPLPVTPGERKILAHVGVLYGGRSVAPILESVGRLINAGKLSATDFRVSLAGPVVEGSLPGRDFVGAACAQGWLEVNDQQVPQKDARDIMRTAHALLLVQPQSVLQVPGKLYEYLQIGRPILAYVPPNSPVERILARSGVPYQCVYPSTSPNEFDQAILQFLQFRQPEHAPNDWFESQFNALSHAQKVSDLIQLVHRARVPAQGLSEAVQD